MLDDASHEWHPNPRDWLLATSDSERLRAALRYAIFAPSGHNTQPWLFRHEGDRALLFADRRRALPVVDPHDRALVISCGAALGMLRAALRHFGHEGEIELLPPGSDPDLLARVGLGASHEATPRDHTRFEAITRRRTTRLRFEPAALPAGLAQEMAETGAADGVILQLIEEPQAKAAIAALVAEGDRAQFADPRFRRELGAWVHSRRAASRDGISGAAFGMPDLLSPVGSLVVRTFDMGEGIAAKDQEIAGGSPALLLVATPGDQPRDWLLAGMAHAEALLAVTAAGLTAAYLNQPVEVDALRPRLRDAAGLAGHPQLLLRLGRGPAIPPAVRRPLEEVLVE